MKRDTFSRWNAIKVKAKHDFTCAHCTSTENIQAHDPSSEHEDWRAGIALCPDCHSKEHPDVPRQLFLISAYQPTWPNISARALAKEIGCHSRTVIRRAKNLGIPSGEALSDEDRERLSKPPLTSRFREHFAILICHVCNKEFQRETREIRRKAKRNNLALNFCSKECQGKWLGANFGFGMSNPVI